MENTLIEETSEEIFGLTDKKIPVPEKKVEDPDKPRFFLVRNIIQEADHVMNANQVSALKKMYIPPNNFSDNFNILFDCDEKGNKV